MDNKESKMIITSLKDLYIKCDGIVYSFKKDHKLIFIKGNEPSNITLDPLRRKGKPYFKSGRRLYDVVVDMYEIKSIMAGDNKPVDIWVVDDLNEAQRQLDIMKHYGAEQFFPTVVPNKNKSQFNQRLKKLRLKENIINSYLQYLYL